MSELRGILNQKGLASFNQGLFDNMACFADVVWVIDIEHEMVEILFDDIEPDMVDHSYTLEEIRQKISSRYPSENRTIVDRYTIEFLKSLEETVYFSNPTFVDKGRRFKLRQSMTPEFDDAGEVQRVYITAINIQNFLSSRRDLTEVYKTISAILSHSRNLSVSVNEVLQYLGRFFNVSRVYIFENAFDDPGYCCNTFEWCEEGVAPLIDDMQHISYEEYGYDQIFSRAQLYCCKDTAELQDQFMRELFEKMNIKAFMNYAFYDNDEFAGFIGIEDHRTPRMDWDEESEEVEILTFVSDLLTTHLIKERNLIRLHNSEAELIEQSDLLKDVIKKDEENTAILEHFMRAYATAYTVDLYEDSFVILHMIDEFKKVFKEDGGRREMEEFVENHVHPDDKALVCQMMDNRYMSERLKETDEVKFVFRQFVDGVEQTMHTLIMRGTDNYHAAVGFMDISEDIQKEREIAEKLEAANKAKRDFLSAMSHDIRTPMNAILGMTDIALRNTDDPEKMVDNLHKIRISGNQLLSLVNDVLDISAIESGRFELRLTPHNVEEGIQQMEATASEILGDKKLDLTFDQHDIREPWIMIDEVRLEQIINNLLSNAIKYTPDGGSVYFENWQEFHHDGTSWGVIKVSDTGIGMSKEFMDRMWDSFSRATDTRVNKIQGAGLGLSIVKSFVELMGGTIDVESELDKGSTFTVRIPFVAAEISDLPEQVAESINEPLALNVLVAEDNDLNWEIINDLLDMNGVACVRAENGEVAVDMFLDSAPGYFDAILMDMQMPIMDGVDATIAIRASKHPCAQTVPIIAVSANSFMEDVEQCKEAGMNDHLSKPINIDRLLALLAHYAKDDQVS